MKGIIVNTQTEVPVRIQELAKRLLEKRSRQATEMQKEIAGKHPHALPETLQYDDEKRKWKCRVKCTETGDESRWAYTSDLHQVDVCEAVQDKRAKAKRGQRQADMKAARAYLASKK